MNSFLVQASGGKYVMIDSGWSSSGAELAQVITNEFGSKTKIVTLVLTHLHPDHFGGALLMQEHFSPPIAYHKREWSTQDQQNRYLEWIRRLSTPPTAAELVSKRMRARMSLMPKADRNLEEGDEVGAKGSGGWSVIHTPGHTPGHICLFQRETRVLISGDHLLPNESSNVGSYPILGYNPLLLYLSNLTRIDRLSPRVVIPSHGEPFGDARGRVAKLFEHHEERLGEVFEAIEEPKTVAGVASCIRWSRGSFESLGEFDKWLAISETQAHLEFLRGCRVADRSGRQALVYRLLDGAEWSSVVAALGKLRSGA